MQCHYEILSVAQDADSATIKKAHRKLAIKYHPDKNLNDEDAAEKFRLVQEAYECLSDVAERKWYDEHRDALLKGWSPNSGGDDGVSMLFDVIPFMMPSCYSGFNDGDDESFWHVYGQVFASLAKEEADAAASTDDNNNHTLPFEFGDSTTELTEVSSFYQAWESFISQHNFSWADQYDVKDAENRRIRRAMEDENKKARKAARKSRNEDVLALVKAVKRRDPRMKALKEKQDREKAQREKELAESKRLKKQEKQQAMEEWRQQAEEEFAQTQEMDDLAGRVRLADLEDDYDYGGGGKKKKKKGKKGKKKNQNNQQQQQQAEEEEEGHVDNEQEQGDSEALADQNGETEQHHVENDEIATNHDDEGNSAQAQEDDFCHEVVFSSEEEEEEEPEVWRCDCCKKDFKSQGQMDNHMKSKKHKEAYKKFQKKLEKELMRE